MAAGNGAGRAGAGCEAVDAVRVTVRVHPGAARTSVGGRYGTGGDGALIVHVRAPAVDGRANQALVEALADALGVRRAQVHVASGLRSRTKIVVIDTAGIDDTAVAARVTELLDS